MTVQSRTPEAVPSLLAQVAGPADLRGMTGPQLTALAGEIRGFLVDKVCATGGHLGVNLGVVELTVALHRVFDSPTDVLLFDTGHQAYVHKMVIGRAAQFDSLRQRGGLSGYPLRAESPHDWIENSHASTALSYADGIAKALALDNRLPDHARGPGRFVVAVIGDGALTGGLAWEGLNNLAAAPDRPVIVVLNDNGRSYAPTIGGIAHHLASLRDHRRQRASWPAAGENLFEQLGLAYIGPLNGHDLTQLETALTHAKTLGRTVVVHAVTAKGRGYTPAETDEADRMHGIGVLDPATGTPPATNKRSWTSVFSAALADIAADRADIVAITAAMLRPVGLKTFADRFPDRVFDVGIAEQQAVCSAAGLAMCGKHPVVCVYATFLGRAFDQVLMDVAQHRLGVTFVLDRAGITGPDGPSHHGMWDIAALQTVPGLRLAAPRDPTRLGELLREAVDVHDAPTVIRFPKATFDNETGADLRQITRMDGLDILHRSHRLGLDVLIVAAGPMAESAVQAAALLNQAGIGATVVDPRWILPIHPTLVHLATRHRLSITAEDGLAHGGAGTALTQACADADVTTPVRNLGLPHAFIQTADRGELLTEHGLTGTAIADTAIQALTDTAERIPEPITRRRP